MERRLAAVLAFDMVGYSRLMGLNEQVTLAAHRRHRRELFNPRATQYRGRIIKFMGDGALMEFASVVDSVCFAVDVQLTLLSQNADLPEERQLRYRIGINIGDIILDEGDIYGDGVNIAARLQELAEPGGILISGTVFDQVKNKLSLGFDFLGPQRLKNIDAEVPVYRAVLQSGAGEKPAAALEPKPAAEAGPEEKWHRFKMSAIRTGAIVVLMILINAFTWDGDLWAQWPIMGVLFLLALQATRIFGR